jgi:hypothetical protein
VRFEFSPKIQSVATFDFCNSIRQKRPLARNPIFARRDGQDFSFRFTSDFSSSATAGTAIGRHSSDACVGTPTSDDGIATVWNNLAPARSATIADE